MDVSTVQTGKPAKDTSDPTPAAAKDPATAKDKLDYDSFLTLLVAQLKFQDPTAPQDSAQYIAQLATFSNVEQSIKLNAKLDQLMTTSALSQADGIIGRTVASEDGSVTGKVASLKVTADGPVAVLENGTELPLGTGMTIS